MPWVWQVDDGNDEPARCVVCKGRLRDQNFPTCGWCYRLVRAVHWQVYRFPLGGHRAVETAAEQEQTGGLALSLQQPQPQLQPMQQQPMQEQPQPQPQAETDAGDSQTEEQPTQVLQQHSADVQPQPGAADRSTEWIVLLANVA